MEGKLEVGISAVDQSCVSVVSRHPAVVSSYTDLRSGAMEPILAIKSHGIGDLGFGLWAIGNILRVRMY